MSETNASGTVRLPSDLAATMNAMKPMARRVAWVKQALRVVSVPNAEGESEVAVARAGIARPESLVEAPVAGVETKMKVALPEPVEAELSPGVPVDGSAPGWVNQTMSLPASLATKLDAFGEAEKRQLVEFALATWGDVTHVDRVKAVLSAHDEVVAIARDLRGLRGLFGRDYPPRLALHVRHAAHTWADKLLKLIGAEVPAVALPPESPALADYDAPPEGVPPSWEPVIMWVPVRMMHRVPDMQASITETLAASDAKWDEIVGAFFKKRRNEGGQK